MYNKVKTKAIEIAQNMLLQLQLGIEEVKKVTGLSTKELKGLGLYQKIVLGPFFEIRSALERFKCTFGRGKPCDLGLLIQPLT